jgi:diaminopimelate epimerase
MRIPFTKMQGAGNDFVVLDATRAPLHLTTAQIKRLGDRRLGVGADQILMVERSTRDGVDFRYRIANGATGCEVEHCGNGARCFVRFVHHRGLSDKKVLRVETVNNLLELHLQDDGRVTVDMNAPIFDLAAVPFNPKDAPTRTQHHMALYQLDLAHGASAEVAVLSMGNPHAVCQVADVDRAPVATLGPQIEVHQRFPRKVNAGFMQVVSRNQIRLRVYERDAGETLACGTGACAAVVAGIGMGLLDACVNVQTRGGDLTIQWQGPGHPLMMTGPAEIVFDGEIEL